MINWKKSHTEAFIEKHIDKVNWVHISAYQKLSEAFIERHSEEVDWYNISCSQKLSEAFIEEHSDRVSWDCISCYQKLSENFIERYADEVYWYYINAFQKLSEKFRKKHKLKTPPDNWLYKSTAFKKKAVQDTGLYECHKDYFIAYKGIRPNRYSAHNFQYKYEKGGVYESTADFTAAENSFGLSAWTEDKAREYCSELVVRIKIYYKDIARVVHEGGKIRAIRIEVLD